MMAKMEFIGEQKKYDFKTYFHVKCKKKRLSIFELSIFFWKIKAFLL